MLLPLAVLGFVLTFRRSDGTRRAALVLLGLWAATVPVAMAISAVLPTPIKLFRVAPFALGLPLLATLALVTSRRKPRAAGPSGTAVGALILVGGLLLTMGTPASSFNEGAGAAITKK